VKAGKKQITEHRKGKFVISTDKERFDLDVVHGFLTECYWAEGIPREVVARPSRIRFALACIVMASR
jgi:hypothetical protein